MTVHLSRLAEHDAAPWARKHLLGLEELSREEIVAILDTAESFANLDAAARKCRASRAGSSSISLRKLDADADELQPGGQAAVGRHARLFRQHLEPVEGGVVHRHRQKYRGDGGRRRGDPASDAGTPHLWHSTSSARSSTPATGRTSTRPRGCWT